MCRFGTLLWIGCLNNENSISDIDNPFGFTAFMDIPYSLDYIATRVINKSI